MKLRKHLKKLRRHQPAKPSAPKRLLFEQLEPRLLLAAELATPLPYAPANLSVVPALTLTLEPVQLGTGQLEAPLFPAEGPVTVPEAEPTNNTLAGAAVLDLVEDPSGRGLWLGRGLGQQDPATSGNSFSDPDYWRFEALAGDLVSISVDTVGSNVDPYVELRTSSEQYLAGDNDFGPGNDAFISRYLIPGDGSYVIKVGKNSSSIVIGSYDLRVELARGVQQETDANYSNDALTGANPLTMAAAGNTRTATVAGTVMGPEFTGTDEDLFSLGALTAGNVVQLDVDLPSGSTMLPRVTLRDGSGAAVTDGDGNVLDGHLQATLSGNSTYYAQVESLYAYNGHAYLLTGGNLGWAAAEAEAQALGGHLATVNDTAEQAWLLATFGSLTSSSYLWIGYTDQAVEGTWQWADGDAATYTNWASGRPLGPSSGGSSADYAVLYPSGGGAWQDFSSGTFRGIIEVAIPGLTGEAGPGPNAQYLLDVSVTDQVAPRVTGLSGLPVAGTTTDDPVQSFTVTCSEGLDPAAVQAGTRLVWSYGGHYYTLTGNQAYWSDAEAQAAALGGHLVTVDDAAEQDWLTETFGQLENAWIGFSDAAVEGNWVWADGAGTTYTNWSPGQPDSERANSDYAAMNREGAWYDIPDNWASIYGIIEFLGMDTDADGLPDSLDTYPMDPLNAWNLRGAGQDGSFETGDDVIYPLTLAAPYAGGNAVSLLTPNGPLPEGHYRFTANRTLKDNANNFLDGNGDGVGGDLYQHTFTVDLPAGLVLESGNNDTPQTATVLPLTENPAGRGLWLGRGLGRQDPAIGFGNFIDPDYWRITAQVGDLISVSVDTPESSINAYVELRSAADQNLRGDDDSGPYSDAFISRYLIPADGDYLVKVGKNSSSSPSGSYELIVTLARSIHLEADANYSNDSLAGANALTLAEAGNLRTATVAGTIMGPESGYTDEDFFNLGGLNTGNVVELKVSQPSDSTALPRVILQNGSGVLVPDEDGNVLDGHFQATLAANSFYYAQVESLYAYNGHVYLLTSGALNWTAAEAEAMALGGHLVTVNDAGEQAWLARTFRLTVGSESYWIGLTDQLVEGSWQWADGTPVTYTNWAPGRPLAPNVGGNQADYAAIDVNGGGVWQDTLATIRGIIELPLPLAAGEAAPGPQAQYLLDANIWASGDLEYADLRVTDLDPPITPVSGETVSFAWTVKNFGNAATDAAAWTDRLVLSPNEKYGDFDDIFLGTFEHTGALGVGDEYTAIADAPLPLRAIGDFRVFVEIDSGKKVFEFLYEGNNVGQSSSRLDIGAPPLPDLVVSDISALAQAIPGQQFPISWTLTNQGTMEASGTWTDRVYLSPDQSIGSDQLMGSFQFTGTIPAGHSVSRSQVVNLPNFAGQGWVVVQTDASDQIFEHAYEFNNSVIDDKPVEAAPAPNLVVTTVTPPAMAFSGQETVVEWTVTNLGQGSTNQPFWHDCVYLSLDSILDGMDVYLGIAANPSYLEAGESYVGSLTATLPKDLQGDYYFLISTDFFRDVFEGGMDQDNLGQGGKVHIELTPPPDLQVISVQAPDQAFSGQPVSLTWQVSNSGTGLTREEGWYDQVYLSADETLDSSDRQLGQIWHRGILAPNGTYGSNLTVETPLEVSGNFFFLVHTDAGNHVYEHAWESNNVGYDATPTNIILTPPPDLEVEEFVIKNVNSVSHTIGIDFRVTNFGATPTPKKTWTDAFYLSEDTFLNIDTDLLVRTRWQHEALGVNESYFEKDSSFRVPFEISGSYYVFFVVDINDTVFELNNANNIIMVPDPITIESRPPDLVVEAPTLPSTALAGRQIMVNWTVRNQGTGASHWIDDKIFASRDEFFDPSEDLELYSLSDYYWDNWEYHAKITGFHLFFNDLEPGESINYSIPVRIPLDLEGDYYIFIQTDAQENNYEGGAESNNLSPAIPFTVISQVSDLQVTAVSAPTTAEAGTILPVNWTVANKGDSQTNSSYWYDRFYLSLDQSISADDWELGSFRQSNPLPSGASYSATSNLTIPINLPGGNYFVIVRTDSTNLVREAPLDNNNDGISAFVSVSPVILGTPDLIVTQVEAPLEAFSGQIFEMSWTVANQGDPVGNLPWYDAVYLSRDQIFDRDYDISLGFFDHLGGLGAGETYTVSREFQVPQGLIGPYYLFVAADSRNALGETSDFNNVNYDNTAMLVTLGAPADLVAGEITIPANAVPGQNVTISYSIKNEGQNPALGSWYDSLYISADELWAAGDPLFGRVRHQGGVLASSSYSETLTAPLPGVVPGDYRVIVRSDIRNQVRESNEANNFAASLDLVAVDAARLELDIPAAGTLGQGQSVYYLVEVAAGQTLQVHLNSGSDSALNELYVRFGEMPSRNQYDVSSVGGTTADARVIVPETEAGIYYVLAYGGNVSEEAPAYTITATSLPFSVESISTGQGGNVGQVTLQINGARFNDPVRVELRKDTTVIEAVRMEVVDPVKIIATFDLTGQSPGWYDLRAVSENDIWDVNLETGDVFLNHVVYGDATLTEAFEVVAGGGAAVNAHLILPEAVRFNRRFSFFLEVANTGNNDLPAPVFLVASRNGAPISTLTTVDQDSGTQEQILVLGQKNSKVLAPGESVRVPLYGFPVDTSDIRIILRNQSAVVDVPLNWDAREWYYRDNSPAVEWQATWSNFKSLVGSTWGTFHDAMRKAAADQALATPEQDLFFSCDELLLDLLARAGNGQNDDSGFIEEISILESNLEIEGIEGLTSKIEPYDLIIDNDPDPQNFAILAALLETENFLDMVAIPALTLKFGSTVGLLWYEYLHTNSSNPSIGYNFISGDEIIDGNLLVFGFRDSFTTRSFSKIALHQATLEISEKILSGEYNCDYLPSEIPIEQLLGESYLNPKGDWLNYSNPIEIPGNIAGGLSGDDSRELSGKVILKKRVDDCGRITSIEVKSGFTLKVKDAIDFIPGGVGSLLEQVFTRPMKFLENYDWAHDIPYTAYFNTVPMVESIPIEIIKAKLNCQTKDLQLPVSNCADPEPDVKDPCDEDNTPSEGISCPVDPRDQDSSGGDNTGGDNSGGDNSGGDNSIWQNETSEYEIDTVISSDPNDIMGPAGYGAEHWITAKETLPYTIRFENEAAATAPAQRVVITQQLDADLDWRTFRVDDFGWGDLVFELPGDRPFYQERLDLTSDFGYFADVSAFIDVQTGLATWTIQTIDPATGEAPADALAGFLPPNNDTGRGEGFVSYSIKPKRTVESGAVVDAQARIVFDTNEPIDTPPIFNTLDAVLPVSAVAPLPDTIEATDFLVSWDGRDDDGGAAIADYTVYVSDNNAKFSPWLKRTTDTEAVFEGRAGHTYGFYSVAYDYAGNVETTPTAPDAVITILGSDTGQISGRKFEDVNGDGMYDEGEPFLAGWTIYLDQNRNQVRDVGEIFTSTDTQGVYSFNDLPPRVYLVAEEPQAGWLQTAPTGGFHEMTLNNGEIVSGLDFGNFQFGEIHGVKFHDLNADGTRTGDEPTLAGWTVFLDVNRDGVLDAGEPSVLTGEDGAFAFTGLGPLVVQVGEVGQDGWLRTTPETLIRVQSGADITADMGNVRLGSLSGVKYEDVDGDGQRDPGEPGLAGWTIFLDQDGNGALDSGEVSTATDAEGRYSFTNLVPGLYTVAEVQRDGWTQTSPFTVAPGDMGGVSTSGSQISMESLGLR